MSTTFPIVVFSHLRWNFVFQRPQHVLSRLARQRPVIFIEEAIEAPEITSPEWRRTQVARNVTVFVPHIPSAHFAPGFRAPELRSLVERFATVELRQRPILWTYTPSATALMSVFDPILTVYDCMDELSAFLHAPAELRQQERDLLETADMVFTGGPSLFRAKRGLHREVYCFPSSVDLDHFRDGTARTEEAADQASIPHPRLGFFGVIDERLDLSLVQYLAEQRPDWQLIFVGPVVKIDPVFLPKAANIHYLGGRNYLELPSYLKGWDVALLPFALNSSTQFISPTKVLEYMAADKAMVSTPIVDVKEPYGKIVRIGETPEQFLTACEAALIADKADREVRIGAGRDVLARTSWDQTAAAMEKLIEASIDERSPDSARAGRSLPVVVAGAGPTGLSAAYHLGDRAVLIEKNDKVGGWCRSVESNGFTFDYAGHIMFSADPYVHQMYKILLGDNVHWQNREAWVYSQDVFTRYPFQGALYGLPAPVVQECLLGAIEARYGVPEVPQMAAGSNGHSQQEKNGTCIKDCCADGLLEAEVPSGATAIETAAPPANFEEFIYRVWGSGIAKHFAIPYNRKLWAVPLAEMETSWLGGRVPMPDIKEMIEGALQPSAKPMGPNARFGYPLRGGFQALMDGFLPHLRAQLLLNTGIAAVQPDDRKLTLSDGTHVAYKHLISTMPLPSLIQLMGDEAPAAVREAAERLRNVSVRCVNIGVGRENLTNKHWIYYPGDTVFHRIFVQGSASPHCNAPGGFGLTCEITYSAHKPLPCDGEELTQLAIKDCIRVGLFEEGDPILTAFQVDMPYAYVVYDHHRKAAVELIREWAATKQITLAGRYSEWEYYNSDHAFIAGKTAAEAATRELAEEVRPRLPEQETAYERQM